MTGPNDNDVTLQRFVHNIQKTGFILEFSVSRLLQCHGWIVVNNKYYLDDVTGNARELDLLAYKVSTCQSIRIYTTLLISCEKSEEHAWALISKQKNERDPNTEWFPISVWSNDPILNFMLTQSKTDWKTRYVDSSGTLYGSLLCPESHIFAFQEMHKKTGVRNDDKRIFSSITSLMKAQAYEMGSLAKRRKEPSLYNFNLIGVIETDVIEIKLNDGVSAIEIIGAKYVGGYIIGRRETTARVHIFRFDTVDSVLENYDRLHINICDVFSRLHESFFDSVMEDFGRVKVLLA